MKKGGISRRGFLTGVAATAATVTILPKTAFGANDRLQSAHIGCGGKGDSDTWDMFHNGVVPVALCDADDGPLNNKHNQFTTELKKKNPQATPDIKKYKDFRKMFEEMGDKIDVVTVSTPDHTHFPGSMAALSLGKHVFTQKPMTHNIWEARKLAEMAREKKLMSLMGIQGHANEAARNLCEWVWAGAIGNVTEVHYWTNRPIWPQGIDRPKDSKPVPKSLDWDCWLNVAPERPYHDAYCPFRWRGWWDYGAGAMGDIGCHVMDAAFWALDLRSPTSVSAESSDKHEETAPKWAIITYEFPARGKLAPCKVIWHDGGKRPPVPKDDPGFKMNPECGAFLFGDKGTLWHDFYCGSARLIPEAKHKDANVGKIPKILPRCKGGHMGEFITACKTGKPPYGANYEYAAALTEFVLLGNLAVRAGQKIEWDPKAMKVTNFADANKWVRREPRKGWDQYYKGLSNVPAPPQPEVGLPKT